jgi:hypothetical protein
MLIISMFTVNNQNQKRSNSLNIKTNFKYAVQSS